jgi:cell division protein FtsL
MLQSLGAELSVRWLLFLGMFLVVLSSGVLAGSQWEKFPPVGQYGVLLAYTLTFWGVSFWAGKQPNLDLTAQTLVIVTLLLVPVNFWAMDSFGLWHNPLQWIVVAIASIILTTITAIICNNRRFVINNVLGKLPLVNILVLSYLHWGWAIPGFPLIAVYLAIAGTTIATIYHTRYQQRQILSAEDTHARVNLKLPYAVIIYALVVLLVRAIFVAGVNVQELGLAIGICGSLVTTLGSPFTREDAENSPHPRVSPSPPLPVFPRILTSQAGGVLLLLGWLVSVSEHYPWQATVVSGLGLWFFKRRLQLRGSKTDVVVIFAIGLQAMWLIWRLVPPQSQQWAIATGTHVTNSQNASWTLLSVALFPYIIFMLVLTNYLKSQSKPQLADFGEKLTLIFGILLTLLSLGNPTLRSLNLLFSTITLASVSLQYTSRLSLAYITQITGVLTLCSIINNLAPHLSEQIWASILIAVTVLGWAFSLGDGIWKRSRWHIGLGLAALSYSLLWINAKLSWTGSSNFNENWGLVWLIIPITLTGIASLGFKRITNIWLSVAALGLSQLLTLPLSGIRLIGLAVATTLMFPNTYYSRKLESAVITVGFGLSFISALLWEGVPRLPHLSLQGWHLVGAISVISLWLGREGLITQNSTFPLSQIYALAVDKWAIVLCAVELLVLSFHSLLVYQGLAHPGFLYLVSSAITLVAIVYRSRQRFTNWGFYGVGWSLELLAAELVAFSEYSLIKISIANITLGLITQFLGEWLLRRNQLERLPNRWHILPLVYGIFGAVLRWHTFAKWTGLSSFAIAFIALGVGRRRQEFRPLVYLGLFGISIAAYEILLYQALQAKGGVFGDLLISMSVLGTGIMYAYRVLTPWILNYLNLTTAELEVVAHLHWFLSSYFLVSASFTPINLKMVGLGAGVFLIRYAIFQGRSFQQERILASEIWVYLGLLEVACLRVYLLGIPIIQSLEQNLASWRVAIASIIAYFLYILPWEAWGWYKRPWQRATYILPLVFLWEPRIEPNPISLLIAASFYIFVAKAANQFRFTYISIILCDWTVFNWLQSINLSDPLLYVTVIGLSLLYIAQLDPYFRSPETRAKRHLLRLLGSGIICFWAIIFHQDLALIPGVFSLVAIITGLALRVRAFLYIGLISFFITSVYQLVVLSWLYSFFKWVIGLLVGIILISLAANFETRRQKLYSLIRNTTEELQTWE